MANEYGDFMDSGFNDDTIWRLGGCPIRLDAGTVAGGGSFSSGGPYIIADGPHVAVGVVSVEVNSAGNLLITTDGSFSPICIAHVTPDETLAGRGISCGPSVGTTTTVVSFSKADVQLDLTTQTDWDKVAGSSSNIWVSWASPIVRGIGQPSLAQQAIDLYTALEARVAALEGN